jgi:hypothetical protein
MKGSNGMTPGNAARVAGFLYIFGMIAGILSIASAVDAPDYLSKAAANAGGVMMAAFFHLLMAPAYMGVAIVLYPVLRKYNPYLAFGFAAFRIMAGIFIVIGVVLLLLILRLSQEYALAGASAHPNFQSLGELLRSGRDLVNHGAMVMSVSLGGLMFYLVLYQSKLVPRWISAWGLGGTGLTMLATLLVMFRAMDIITAGYIAMNVPMVLQEMVMAILLITRGFTDVPAGHVSAKRGLVRLGNQKTSRRL